MATIGVVVIGQSPRPDLESEFVRVLGPGVELMLAGLLDGLSDGDLDRFRPRPGEDSLFAMLPDGSNISLGHAAIAQRAPSCLAALENRGCEIVLFCCTGEFPELIDTPYMLPASIVAKTTAAVVRSGHLGIFVPLVEQVDQATSRWSRAGIEKMSVVPIQPNASAEAIDSAATQMARYRPDYVVYDCMGYSHAFRLQSETIIQRPGVLSVSIVARILDELSGGT